MKQLKLSLFALAICTALFLASAPVFAESEKSSDTWIQTKLVMTYVLNRHLSTFDINTDVRDRVVYLKGTVETPIEKDLAGEIARSIKDVKNVQNDIVVDSAQGSMVRKNPSSSVDRTFAQTVNDMTITASIKTKYLTSDNLNEEKVEVETRNNVVTLNGSIPSDAERQLAVKIAENTEDVNSVKNNLTIASKL